MNYKTNAKIVLIRHGQTEWNVAGRRQGHGDSPLTILGKRQAHAIGISLRKHAILDSNVDIISSPIGRALSTAMIICGIADIPVGEIEKDSRLVEADHGEWEGLTKLEIEEKFPGEMDKRLKNKWNYNFPKGESYQALSIRVDHWLKSVKSQGTVAVVTHDMISRVLRKQYLGLSSIECLSLKHDQSGYFILEGGNCTRYEVFE